MSLMFTSLLTQFFFVIFALSQPTEHSIGSLVSYQFPLHFEIVGSDSAVYRSSVYKMNLFEVREQAYHILLMFLELNQQLSVGTRPHSYSSFCSSCKQIVLISIYSCYRSFVSIHYFPDKSSLCRLVTSHEAIFPARHYSIVIENSTASSWIEFRVFHVKHAFIFRRIPDFASSS